MKKCLDCDKTIRPENKTGYCLEHYRLHQKQDKINTWLETGDTGCQIATTLRSCIREYIYKKQNYCCSICNQKNQWNEKELKFVLDHIDGNASNNEESNLRLICPNCDSQLDTFKSKNKNSARKHRKDYN